MIRTAKMAPFATNAIHAETLNFKDGLIGMYDLVGASELNPQGMTKNCVSVTFAKILEFPNVNEF